MLAIRNCMSQDVETVSCGILSRQVFCREQVTLFLVRREVVSEASWLPEAAQFRFGADQPPSTFVTGESAVGFRSDPYPPLSFLDPHPRRR